MTADFHSFYQFHGEGELVKHLCELVIIWNLFTEVAYVIIIPMLNQSVNKFLLSPHWIRVMYSNDVFSSVQMYEAEIRHELDPKALQAIRGDRHILSTKM